MADPSLSTLYVHTEARAGTEAEPVRGGGAAELLGSDPGE